MSDIVTRLRNWRNVHLARLHILMDEAADEMERLRDTPATHATHREGIEQDGCTLTDAEREAVCMAMTMYEFNDNDDQCAKIAATLRGLLERMA